ncbi:MAG: hypothetical protein NTW07_08165 [candidate division Zixibacteria bacterium]|nr:hypothetical protein [candidate division Zixibacteria bacterium]
MRSTIIVLLVAVTGTLVSDVGFCRDWVQTPVDWKRISTLWEGYLEYPSSDNALLVYNALPKCGASLANLPQTEDRNEAIEKFYDELAMLEVQVCTRDRNAVRLAFRLMPISDGAFAEWLDIMLGRLIRIAPRLFLEELAAHRDCVTGIGPLVGNQGGEFVDRFRAMSLESQLRFQALDSIPDTQLANVRKECLNALREDIRDSIFIEKE